MPPIPDYEHGHKNGEQDAWLVALREGFAELRQGQAKIHGRLDRLIEMRCIPRGEALASVKAGVARLWWAVSGGAAAILGLAAWIIYIAVEGRSP